MRYPKIIHASVLLLDGKIVNWKIGVHCWDSVYGAFCSRQPYTMIHRYIKKGEEGFSVDHITKTVENTEENNDFFRKEAREFIKKYDYHELFKGAKA